MDIYTTRRVNTLSVLIVLVIAVVFVSCGSQADPASTPVPTLASNPPSTATPTATTAPTVEPTQVPTPTPAPTATPPPAPTPTSTREPKEEQFPDAVLDAIAILENEFEALRTSDADLFLEGCHPTPLFKAGGIIVVKAALEAAWPPEGQDLRADNIKLVNHLPEFVILGYDLIKDGQFVEAKFARMEIHGGGVNSLSAECGMTQ